MKKLVVSLALVIALVFGATAFAAEKTIRVGLVMNQATTQVISTMANHMVKKCQAMGVEATLVYYEMDVATMINQIENFTNSGYDGIAVLPMNPNDGAGAMQAAKDAGLKVVTFDTIPACDYDYSFTASNTDLGYKIGEAAAKWAKEALVAKGVKPIIGVINRPQSEFLTERANGTLKALAELLPEGEVVISAAGDTEPMGLEAGENFLIAYPDMNVVCTINDDTGSGVFNAFSAAGYAEAKDRGLFTCDGTLTGLTNVSKGGFHKTCIDLSLPTVGEWMMEALVAAIKGEKSNYAKDTHFPMTAVTAENAAKAIADYNGD
jgi:ABC-type sugar transport system substrate-binding protein